MPIKLETENLTYVYNEGLPNAKYAVSDLSVQIKAGEVIGIIGHTGSGKSTLIQHFNGLLKPSSGRVLLDGVDIWSEESDLRAVRFRVGLVFQYPEYQLFEETVEKDIAFGPRNMGLSESEITERVREAAQTVGILPLLKRSPFELSGGQKRRAALAGILAMRPEVLILDEPASGLDPAGKREIFREIMEYRNRSGATVLIVSHSMEDIACYADRVMVLNEGEMFCFDTPEHVFTHAQELREIGLAVPSVSSLLLTLRSSGITVNPAIYRADQAAQEILRALKRTAEC